MSIPLLKHIKRNHIYIEIVIPWGRDFQWINGRMNQILNLIACFV